MSEQVQQFGGPIQIWHHPTWEGAVSLARIRTDFSLYGSATLIKVATNGSETFVEAEGLTERGPEESTGVIAFVRKTQNSPDYLPEFEYWLGHVQRSVQGGWLVDALQRFS